MKKAIPFTLGVIPAVLLLLALAVPAQAQRPYGPPYAPPPPAYGAPNVSGQWFMNGNRSQPCQIDQQPDGSALFTNENGSQAYGSVRGGQVFIPSWTDGMGSQGLTGTLQGNRIVWPNGTFWSR